MNSLVVRIVDWMVDLSESKDKRKGWKHLKQKAPKAYSVEVSGKFKHHLQMFIQTFGAHHE